MIKTVLIQIKPGQNNIGKLLLFKFEQTTLIIFAILSGQCKRRVSK